MEFESEIQLVQKEVTKQVAWSDYAAIHGTKAAIDHFSKESTKFSLKRAIVNV